MRFERIFAALIAVAAWSGLLLQFYLVQVGTGFDGISQVERTVRFFSYFTVLSNIVVAITLTAHVVFPRTKIGEFFSRASTQAAVAVYITIVGLIYSLFLRSVWNPQGMQGVIDHLLHDVTPIGFVIYWIFFAPKSRLGWLEPFKWLAYPLIYIVYSIVRGAFVNWYPYYFADVTQLGYPMALRNSLFVLAAFVIVGLAYVGASKLLVRPSSGS